ncbi:sugar ABC transporter ATP-binding protein [Diplocloster modestus]|uniref:Sugar ABC transporter ATP-binding protein n=1 Tax=Diplocloster modestus TaxID=2850322 RepID=A0ABS6K1K3_9FIRM|nr:sugar ABC transporter ATP-binding protein [Diplocloster modestus]MBU9724730.1 sugar ABC transporter ATP-binding protein [Diplocloster modestus]
MAEKLLELRHVSKKFSGVTALEDVSIDIEPGEVLTLVGENGAGKSTLIKVITGAHHPTEGELWFEGKKIENNSPAKAKELGIGVIYQELNMMPTLTVAENIFYGKELKKGIVLRRREMLEKSNEIIQELGANIDASKRVSELSIAEQQIVEIVKAVSEEIKLLIMDEPTAPLTNSEIEKMFDIVERLRKRNVAILYISHRLEEVFRISERTVVLRDGKHVITVPTRDIDRQMLIKYMVGRELGQEYPARTTEIGEVILKADHLINDHLKDCSLELKKGEILGLAGLVGAGRTEMARAIFGADPLKSGELTLHGKKVKIKSPEDAISHGIGLITEDRKNQGLLLNQGIDYNVSYANLKSVCRFGVINKKKETQVTKKYVEAMDIKIHSLGQMAKTLSGGNQQKVVLGKWLATNSEILIFDEPTRGIDVGAKSEIYQLMRRLIEEGKSIIMISSEMPELIGMSDRILVMHDGRITGEINDSEVTQEKILEFATR